MEKVEDVDAHLTPDMKVIIVQFNEIISETSRAGMMLPILEL